MHQIAITGASKTVENKTLSTIKLKKQPSKINTFLGSNGHTHTKLVQAIAPVKTSDLLNKIDDRSKISTTNTTHSQVNKSVKSLPKHHTITKISAKLLKSVKKTNRTSSSERHHSNTTDQTNILQRTQSSLSSTIISQPKPPEKVTVWVNPNDGLLATKWTEDRVQRTYNKGEEPQRHSTLDGPPPVISQPRPPEKVTVWVNPNDGLLATKWTEDRVQRTYNKGEEPQKHSTLDGPPPGEH